MNPDERVKAHIERVFDDMPERNSFTFRARNVVDVGVNFRNRRGHKTTIDHRQTLAVGMWLGKQLDTVIFGKYKLTEEGWSRKTGRLYRVTKV